MLPGAATIANASIGIYETIGRTWWKIQRLTLGAKPAGS
jgi:hypothetical protein